ncbi:MAG: amidohydrolase family protein [Acidimicrobiales bacterium]
MTYAGERVILDADSHLMELADFLDDVLDPSERDRFHRGMGFLGPRLEEGAVRARQRRSDPDAAAEAEQRVLLDKGWTAMGSFDPAERSRVLDLLGFEAQLVFPTYSGMFLLPLDNIFPENAAVTGNVDLLSTWCRALNTAMANFCAHDKRLRPVGFVSLTDPARAAEVAEDAIAAGCAALWIPSTPAGALAPTHPSVDCFWEVLERTNTPFVLHVGGSGEFPNRAYHNNELPLGEQVGDGEKLRAKDLVALSQSPAMFLGALILDGLFDRFPRLRGGCIEQGAGWVVSWINQLDYAQRTFQQSEEPLRRLQATPSEYVRRHLKFTPHPGERVGWMMEQAGSELFMFSSDYPHPEGGHDPIAKFESELAGLTLADRERFYAGNMAELLAGSSAAAV